MNVKKQLVITHIETVIESMKVYKMTGEKLKAEIDKLKGFIECAYTLEILTDYEYECYFDILYRLLH